MGKLQIYLDTSAYNFLLKSYPTRKISRLIRKKCEVLFSSCNLDEFGLAESPYSSILATFAWEITNQRKLLDHIELMFREILLELKKIKYHSYYDEADIGFIPTWISMKDKLLPEIINESASNDMYFAKTIFKDFEMNIRKSFHSFNTVEKQDSLKRWQHDLKEIERQRGFNQFLITNLYNYSAEVRDVVTIEELLRIDYKKLKATAVGLQYYFALVFIHTHLPGKHSKPNFGDQIDFRHAFYAGIVDYFVTSDRQMLDILNNYVLAEHCQVLDTETFAENFLISGYPGT